jgi:multidrug efflux pump subunit AcrA (membrane-fusion protein)
MKKIIPLLVIALLTTGCSKNSDTKSTKTSPAKVEKVATETEIGRITLTPEAEERLGILLSPITEQDVQRRRTLGGDVMIPIGKSITVNAPFSGTVAPPDQATIPSPGQKVDVTSTVLTLLPILTPERDVPTPAEQVLMANARATLLAAVAVAQGDVQRGLAEVEAAKIALARAEKLFADRAGSERAVDDAIAQLNISESVLHAATEREQQLSLLVKELDKPASERTATPLAIKPPQPGVLRSLAVTQGQAVSAGALLFEVVDTDTMWIRVPVYVEMLADIDSHADARVVALGATTADKESNSTNYKSAKDTTKHDQVNAIPKEIVASPVVAPPSADPLSSSVDLYFECKNENALLRPGQRVGVQLAIRGKDRGLTAPAKAIIYDIYGGTWVYIRTADHSFQRQRVLIRYMLGDRAVLAEGPAAGTEVVTDGAAELFGTEFGAGK